MANVVAHGFQDLRDLFPETVTNVLPEVNEAIQKNLAIHQKIVDSILAILVEKTTGYKEKFKASSLISMEDADEFAKATVARDLFSRYDNAWPLLKGVAATGVTYDAAQKMTVQMANDLMDSINTADLRWLSSKFLQALFANAAWTFADPEFGSLTINGLANDDTVKYIKRNDASGGVIDTHYLANANAISDTYDPYPGLYSELTEHPENDGDVVVLIASSLKATTEALTAFKAAPDSNLQYGNGLTLLSRELNVQVPGDWIGYHTSKCYIAEWKSLPDGYMVGLTTNGIRPLRMREEAQPGLQGLRRVAETNDHPFYKTTYERIAGFGAHNRVGAVVKLIGSASYAVPTGYTAPTI